MRFSFAFVLLLGGVFTFGQSEGEKLWEFAPGNAPFTPVLDPQNNLYFGASTGTFFAFDKNGLKKWEFNVGTPVRSAAAMSRDGTVLYFVAENKLIALGLDGRKRFECMVTGQTGSSPAVGWDGTIYFGATDDRLHAVAPDGTKRWEFRAQSSMAASWPVIGRDGTIYAGSLDSRFYAIKPDGTKKWEFMASRGFAAPAAIGADGTIYIGAETGVLYALTAEGIRKWSFLTSDSIYAAPTLAPDGTVYAVSDKLYALRPDGTLKWTFPKRIFSTAVAADGTVYAVGLDNLYALSSTGQQKWAFQAMGSGGSGPMIAPDGTIYHSAGTDNKLLAIRGSAGPAASSWPLFRRDQRNSARMPPLAIVLVSPDNRATFYPREPIQLTAAVGLTQAVQRVEFFAGTNRIGLGTTPPYTFVWTNAPLGSHLLSARVIDAANQVYASASVSISIASRLSVRITSPADDTIALIPANIPITAEADALDGRVVRVEFFQGAIKLGEVNAPPYRLIWSNVLAGQYTLTARAADDLGANQTSAPVRVTVRCPDSGCEMLWVGGAGSWFNATNWNPLIPTLSERATINNGGTAEIVAGIAESRGLTLAGATGTSGHVVQRGGTNQTSAVSMAIGTNSRASYTLHSGVLDSPATVGYLSQGSFTNQSGLHTAAFGGIVLGEQAGGSGTYHLGSNGIVRINSVRVGEAGTGFFHQVGGRLQASSSLELSVAKRGGRGDYLMTGGEIDGFITEIGYDGIGTFKQHGGTNRIGGILSVGYFGRGSYELHDRGLLTTHDAYLGWVGIGALNQIGGRHTSHRIWLGRESPARGSYTISGGQLTANELHVGEAGLGHFTMSSASAGVVISNLIRFGTNSQFTAVPGSRIVLRGPFENLSKNGAALAGLTHLTLVIQASTNQLTIEAAGNWDSEPGMNFGLGGLSLGESNAPVQVRLADATDNDGKRGFREVLFLDALWLAPGSVLNLHDHGLGLQKNTELTAGEIRIAGGRIAAPAGLRLGSSAVLVGNGEISGTLTNAGRMEVLGGILSVEEYVQAPAGELNLQLGGVTTGWPERLGISDRAQFDGALNVRLANDFLPKAGDSFEIASYKAHSGTFSRLNLPALGDGLKWELLYEEDSLFLVALASGPPVIVSSPTHQTVLAGETVRLRVVATGEPAPVLQWEFNGTPVAGATNSTLVLTNAAPAQSGIYRAIARNINGAAPSASATVTVRAGAAPVITQHPVSQTGHPLDDIIFSVGVSAAPAPTYQWRFNGTHLSGATSNQLVLSRVQPRHAGFYSVIVSNSFGVATSAAAGLSLFPAEAVPTVPVGNPGNPADTLLSNTGQRHGAVDYEFRIGKYEINNTQYAAFLNAVAKSDAYDLFNSGMEMLSARGIERTGLPGAFQYSVKPAMELKPVVFVSFFDAVRFVNWLHNGRPIGFQDESTTEAGAYLITNQRRNDFGFAIGDVSPRLRGGRWFLPSVSEWHKAAYYDPVKSGSGGYWLYATRNDSSPVAEFPPGGSNSVNYANIPQLGLTENGGYPASASAYGTRDQNGNVLEWTETSRFTDRFLRGGAFDSPEQLLRATDETFAEQSIENYAVGFRVGEAGPISPFPPTIHLQPSSRRIVLGQSASFAVQATAEPPAVFQWFLNGQLIPGATNYKLHIPSVQVEHLGAYATVVSNAFGTVRSGEAMLETFPSNVSLAFWGADSDGLWSDSANWLSQRVPKANDYVVIDRPAGHHTVTYGGDVPYLHSLYSDESFTLLSGILNVSNTVQVNRRFAMLGGVLANATVLPGSFAGRAVNFVGAQQARLRNVTMNADMDLTRVPEMGAAPGRVQISGGIVLNGTARLDGESALVFDATQSLSGTGQVHLGRTGGSVFVAGDQTLTIGPGLTIRGGTTEAVQAPGSQVGSLPPFTPGASRLINQGLIQSDVEGGIVTIGPQFFVNRGRLAGEAGATLAVISTWTNHGVISGNGANLILGDFFGSTNRWRNLGLITVSNSTVLLGGTFETRALGDFHRSGGQIRLVGKLDNRGSRLLLDENKGSWVLADGSILGGVVETGGEAKLVAEPGRNTDANVLDGVTLEGELDLLAANASVQIQNGLKIDGTVAIGNTSTVIVRNGALTVSERGTVRGGGLIGGSVTNSGRLSPGNTIGKLSISGALVQTSSGRVEIQLGGTLPGTSDQVAVAAKAALGGRLELSLAPGFVPPLGHSFTVLTFQLRQGQFEFVRLPALARGQTWKLAYGPASVTAQVVNGMDADADGMFDQWETLFGLDPVLAADATADSDGDGMSNVNEFGAGTDPRDASSVFRFSGIHASEFGVDIQVSSVPGKRYQLQGLDSGGWHNIGPVAPAEGGVVSLRDESAKAASWRWYRVLIID